MKKTTLIAEIGTNHGGCINTAMDMIREAKRAGFDAVKFQKRDPDVSTPEHMKEKLRETPWGTMSYLEYRKKVEFRATHYRTISAYCSELGIDWGVSAWDIPSIKFMHHHFKETCRWIKIPSAKAHLEEMIHVAARGFHEVWISTGGMGAGEVSRMLNDIKKTPPHRLVVFHTTAIYPCPREKANIGAIQDLYYRVKKKFPEAEIGCSAHTEEYLSGAIAVALGATHIERHFTTDRSLYGGDNKISLTGPMAANLTMTVRHAEELYGSGHKEPFAEEEEKLSTLR